MAKEIKQQKPMTKTEIAQQMQQNQPRIKHEDFMKDPYFAKWYPKWIENAMMNYSVIKSEFNKKDRCLSTMPRPMNKPCIILGAGPSADEHLEKLKDWKNPIFTSASVALSLARYEREPEYISAFDSLWKVAEQIKGYKWKTSTLLTHPNAEPKMIKNWVGNKYYYRRVFPGHEFFEFTFPLMFPWIRIGLRFSGSVVNNMMTIAQFLGYNPIILLGVDYGWRDIKKNMITRWEKSKGEWIKMPQPIWNEKEINPILFKDDVYSKSDFVHFKSGLLSIIGSAKSTNIIDCSDGIVTEFTKVPFDKVLEEQGWGNYKFDKKREAEEIQRWFYYLKVKQEQIMPHNEDRSFFSTPDDFKREREIYSKELSFNELKKTKDLLKTECINKKLEPYKEFMKEGEAV